MKDSLIGKVVIIAFLLSFSSFSLINIKVGIGAINYDAFKMKELSGKELLRRYSGELSKESVTIEEEEEEEPIFWDLDDNDTIDYNPVVLHVNYYYWDYLPIYDEEEDFIFEIFANGETIFNSSYEYSNYDDYWIYGYDWNISSYNPRTEVNITVFFYQENNPMINHTASIKVTIEFEKNLPPIDLDDFKINLFHWPGVYYSSGYYPYWDPDGPNLYYHFTIYSDGLCELKFGQQSLMESHDYSAEEARAMMLELQRLGFFDLKEVYFAPSYDYFECSQYQIYADSRSVQEWREAEESYDYRTLEFLISPSQYSKILNYIINELAPLYFKPKRWSWQLIFWIAGGTVGGCGCCTMLAYLVIFRRR